ncbi:caspase family protein [Kaarinaea lacus]
MKLSATLSRTSVNTRYIALVTLLLALLVSHSVPAGISIRAIEKSAPVPSTTSNYRALIIGNNDYKDPDNRWPPLKTAVTDAKAVANLLESHYNFQDVTVLENASRSEILHAINGLTRRVNNNDSVLLYYAGHGYLDRETNKGYWIPVDAKGNDHTTYLRNSTIRDELNTIASRAKHTLLISDSCFSGSLLRGVTRGPVPSVDQDRYYQNVAAKKSVQIIAAGGVEFVDDNYADSGHSPFTYFLLNELSNNNKPVITASEISSNVEQAVANNSSQNPESGVLQGAGDELGEFIFLKLDIAVEVKGIPKDKVKVDVHVTPSTEDAQQEMPATTQNKSQAAPPKKREIIPLPTL